MMVFKDKDTFLIILIYIDDILITKNGTSIIREVIIKPNSKFALKNLCDLSYFLGLEVVRR